MKGLAMKRSALLVLLAVLASGCTYDPRAPIDTARREIHDIQAFQLQAERLRPLQEDLERSLFRDPRVRAASAGLYFACSSSHPYGARLTVRFVLVMELWERSLACTQPADLTPDVLDMVREALSARGWEVEDVEPYSYENTWQLRGQIRGTGKPPSAGAGLEILPG